MKILTILFGIDVAIILISALLYTALIKVLIRFSRIKMPTKSNYHPKITIIIPTHNEEANIEKKLINLSNLDYNKKNMKILVVDDCSTDKTSKIVRKFKKFPVKLIELKSHKGKIAAINRALMFSDSEIIIISDADSILDKNAIKNLVSYLSKSKIGGVTGNIIINIKPSYYSIGQKKFQDDENYIRNYEGMLDSVSSMDGRLCAFKKSIIKYIDEKAAADDLELAHQIRRKGYRVVFAKEALAYEKAPTNIKAEFEQKRRRSLYSIITIFKYIDMLFNFKYGYFGMVIFPFRRFFGLLSPFLLLFAFFYLLINFPYFVLFTFLIAIFLLTFKNIRSILVYDLLIFFSILTSWIDLLFTRGKVKGKWSR